MVDVIIFLVGLTLLTDDGGVKAILPRVVHTNGPNTELVTDEHARARPTGDVEMPTGRTQHMQNHRAAIVFYKDSFLQQLGWGAPVDLPPRGGRQFQYVKLDGDFIDFDTGTAPNVSADLSGVVLPGLKQQLCPAKMRLRHPYKLPYAGASAVILLPEGQLRACLTLPVDSPGRLDTQVDLRTTNSVLIIRSNTSGGPRELHLKPGPSGKIELMIANVPDEYYQDDYTEPSPSAINGVSHRQAYYAMAEPNSNCDKQLLDWWHELENPDPIFLCNALQFPASGPIVPQSSPATMVAVAASFDCSNSQWP
jgi:hypothetical protein